jgi:hypothetical protein
MEAWRYNLVMYTHRCINVEVNPSPCSIHGRSRNSVKRWAHKRSWWHNSICNSIIQSKEVRHPQGVREFRLLQVRRMEEETTVTALSLWRDEIVSGLSLRFYFHWAQSLRALVAWMMCPDGRRNKNCYNGSLQISHSILAQSPQNSIYGIQHHMQAYSVCFWNYVI